MRCRTGPAAGWRSGRGYTFIEIVFVAGLVAICVVAAVPGIQRAVDEFRVVGATRYLASRIERTRMDALARSSDVALRFVQDGVTYRYAVYVDGNANGVRSTDIESGIDWRSSHEERLSDQFAGVDLGTVPDLPAVDSSSAAPGADPVRLGPGNMATFTPDGTATPGSLYVRGPRGLQFVIRITGETGRARVLRFDALNRVWRRL